MTRTEHCRTEQQPLREMDDRALVRLAQGGNDPAFEELISRYRAKLFKMAAGILRNQDDAEDELQNALWNAYRNIGGFEQNAQFSTWITRILLNQCLMRIRKDRRRQHVSIDNFPLGDEVTTLDLPDQRPSQEQTLSGGEVETALRTEVKRLPRLMRQVLLLVHLDEIPIPEAAVRLGISVPAAKSRLLRARRELRRRMERHLLQPGAMHA